MGRHQGRWNLLANRPVAINTPFLFLVLVPNDIYQSCNGFKSASHAEILNFIDTVLFYCGLYGHFHLSQSVCWAVARKYVSDTHLYVVINVFKGGPWTPASFCVEKLVVKGFFVSYFSKIKKKVSWTLLFSRRRLVVNFRWHSFHHPLTGSRSPLSHTSSSC